MTRYKQTGYAYTVFYRLLGSTRHLEGGEFGSVQRANEHAHKLQTRNPQIAEICVKRGDEAPPADHTPAPCDNDHLCDCPRCNPDPPDEDDALGECAGCSAGCQRHVTAAGVVLYLCADCSEHQAG